MLQTIRVVLADPQTLVRETLRLLIRSDPCLHVVGDAATGNDALDMILGLHPDVAMIDVDTGGRSCFDITHTLRAMQDPTAVLVLGARHDPACIRAALQAGVAGYLSKEDKASAILEAIHLAAKGQTYFSPQVREHLHPAARDSALGLAAEMGIDLLSLREKEVLLQLARGLSVKQVAGTLSLSRKTVDNHTQRLMAKLDIHSRADLVRFAIRERLVPA